MSETPRQIGDWNLLKRLDAGATGEVFIAEHAFLGRRAVLRVMPQQAMKEEGFDERFRAMAGKLARARHPHLANLLNAGSADGASFLVFELVDAQCSLEEHLAAQPGQRVPEAQARTWARQIAGALVELHAAGLVHRDLHAGNILLDDAGDMKIVDAGLAGLLKANLGAARIDAMVQQIVARRANAPAAASPQPTPAAAEHLAPEQRFAGQEPDHRADIYAFGVLLRRMLCGAQQHDPAPPSQVVPGLSKQWDMVVARCLAVAPEGRYPSSEALLAALPGQPAPAPAWRKRRVALALLAGGVLGLMLHPANWVAPRTPAAPQMTVRETPGSPRPGLASRDQPAATMGAPSPEEQVPLAEVVALKAQALAAWEQASRAPRTMVTAALLDLGVATALEAEEYERQDSRFLAKLRYEQLVEVSRQIMAAGPDAVQVAREDYLRLLREMDAARLAMYGGRAWEAVQAAAAGGYALNATPEMMAQAYRQAMALLPAARQAADDAFAAEQARLELESQVRALLVAAQRSANRGAHALAIEQVDDALRLSPGLPAALALREAIQPKLALPVLSVEVGPSLSIVLQRIEAGKFLMGEAPREGALMPDNPRHEVTLTRPFYLGRTEVTVAQFASFVRETDYRTLAEKEGYSDVLYALRADERPGRQPGICWRTPGFPQAQNGPAVCIAWIDAVEFCRWLSQKTGRACRLPTEAEWEYACRAGTATRFWWGNEEADGEGFLNCLDGDAARRLSVRDKAPWADGEPFASQVARYKPNPWALYDMHGGVAEWCLDAYAEYPKGAVADPRVESDSPTAYRVVRGGSWFQMPYAAASAYRARSLPTYRNTCIGFRVLIEAPRGGS